MGMCLKDFNDTECSLKAALCSALNLVDPIKGPIISLSKTPRYNDEPLLFQYFATFKRNGGLSQDENSQENTAGGMSFSREKAVMKTLGEAVERYCLASYEQRYLVHNSFDESKPMLDPSSVVSIAPAQLKSKECSQFQFGKQEKFLWANGYSLTRNSALLIPAQLVYVPYYFDNEPVIRFPITTGAASGTSLSGAVIRGLCEVIERDAFMIFYLNKLTPPVLDLSNSKSDQLRNLPKIFKRYNLELYIFNITTDIPVTSIMAMIIDKTGVGPAVTVGLKTALDAKLAIIGAIEEAEQMRPWIRDELYLRGDILQTTQYGNLDLTERGLLWSKTSMIKHLNFFLKSKSNIAVDQFLKIQSMKMANDLESLIQNFKQMEMEVCCMDVTLPEVDKVGFKVVKVIVPQLQPLYLTEEFKYLGGSRLYTVPQKLGYKKTFSSEKELNCIPHPFL